MSEGGDISEVLPSVSSARKQWRRIIHASQAAQRIASRRQEARPPDLPINANLEQIPEENGNHILECHAPGRSMIPIDYNGSPVITNPEAGGSGNFYHLDILQQGAIGNNIPDKVMVQYLQNVRNDLLKQLNSYGLILTVLVTITFVAFLQPPGGYDGEGKMRSSSLITSFIVFATLSFLFACLGVITGLIGSITLFRPGYFPPIGYYYLSQRCRSHQASLGRPVATAAVPQQHHHHGGIHLHRSLNEDQEEVFMDSAKILGDIVLDNVDRVHRLAIYMGLSLLTCVIAFICGGLAVTKDQAHPRIVSLLVAIGVGVVCVFIEAIYTAHGPTFLRYRELRAAPGLRDVVRNYKNQNVNGNDIRTNISTPSSHTECEA